ncbi:MFS transporter [Jiella mangrovi]|uniref:MFS transporter n=1 Tax=Jiella mangrovi TaxID=2821407 RepID=A0ABS4BHF7_9HYPH|nr:MFS transporter [Jiella mangrovi]MBP0615395.1 MFS transporter [Jiella mangrovi]
MERSTPDDIVAEAEAELESVDWLTAAAAIASISAVGIALGLGLPLLSVILERRGISSSMIGLNAAVAGGASLAAAAFITPIAMRLSVSLTMLISIVLASVSAVAFFFAPFWMWFPLRLVFHFAITALFVLSEFWINAAAPPGKRGLVLGIYATVLSLGFALGPWIFSQVGSQGFLPFGIGAGVILLSAIPLFIAWSRQPVISKERRQGSFWRHIFAVPTATGAVLVFGAVEAGGFALFPVYGERVGFSESAAAQLLTAVGIGNVLMQIPIGLMSDRVKDRRTLLSICAGVGLIGTLCLPVLVEDWWLMAGVLFLWGGVVAGLYTVGLAHLGARLPAADLADANAAFIFCYSAGMLIGPQTIGTAMDLFGPNGFAWSLALFFAIYLALALGRLFAARS